MHLQIHAKPVGTPRAVVKIASNGGDKNERSKVALLLNWVDAYDICNPAGSLTLSAAEARALAARLVQCADEADALDAAMRP